jgi:plasmid stabilization system protein ParE
MSASIGFHPLVQKDINEILEYYESEAGLEVADRFETEFRMAISAIRNGPRHFPSNRPEFKATGSLTNCWKSPENSHTSERMCRSQAAPQVRFNIRRSSPLRLSGLCPPAGGYSSKFY